MGLVERGSLRTSVAAWIYQKGRARPPAVLTVVDGFTTTEDGQVIEGLDIWCENNPLVINHRVTLRWCRIWHRNGLGIRINADGEGSRLSDFSVEHVAPPEGVEPFPEITNVVGQVNIYGYQAVDVIIERVKLSHGASGVYLQECDDVHVSVTEGGPFHGPFPRGQLYQENTCTNCSVTNWSGINPVDASWPEDTINIYGSTNFYVGRGYAEGNNAPNGVAVMAENGSVGVVEDVDAVGMWNGAFGAWGEGTDVVFRRVRTRDNYEPEDNPGGRTPGSTSNGATFVAAQNAEAELLQAKYFNVSNPANVRVEFEDGVFTAYEAEEEDFTARAPVTVTLPDWPVFDIPPEPEPSANLWADSDVPSNAAWTKSGVTVSAGTGEGGSDAVRETATTGEHQWNRTQAKDAGAAVYQVRFRIKPQGRTRLNLFVFNAAYSANTNGYFFFSGTPNFQGGAGDGGMGGPLGGGVADDGDGFYECHMTFTSSADTSMPIIFYVSAADYEQSHAGNVSLGFDVENLRLLEEEVSGPFDYPAPEPDPWTIGDWAAGSNTTLSIAGGRARLTRNNGNPRIMRQVTGLTEGQTYRVQTNGYLETATSLFFRIGFSTDPDLSFGNIKNIGGVGAIDETFVAPADGIVNIGFVAVASNNTQYAETDENFTFGVAE